MQRVVGRAELTSGDSAPSTSPEPAAIERLKHLGELSLVSARATVEIDTQGGDRLEDDDNELDFRMFATSNQADESTSLKLGQKIRLRSRSVDNNNAGFIQPQRDRGYYFAETTSATKRQQLEAAAVTGQNIIARSQSSRPGSTYVWKILHLPPSSVREPLRKQQSLVFSKLTDDGDRAKRKRPGKKYRIQLRTAQAALRKQRYTARAAAETKETAERDKRTRRNREKKVKKKMRDKAKKSNNANNGAVAMSEAG